MRMETADIFWRQEIRGWRQEIRLETAEAGLETAEAGLETADIFWRQQIFFGDSRYIWRQQIYLETGDIFQVDLVTPRRCPYFYPILFFIFAAYSIIYTSKVFIFNTYALVKEETRKGAMRGTNLMLRTQV